MEKIDEKKTYILENKAFPLCFAYEICNNFAQLSKF